MSDRHKDEFPARKVLVTGGNGFLGRHLVRKLHERGADVFIADMDRYDLRHLDDIRRALSDANPRMVIHLAARHRPLYPRMNLRALRTKLGDDAANPKYIQSIHGVGYRWPVPVTRAASG